MKQLKQILCRLLIITMAWTPMQLAHAGMIGTGDQVAVTSAAADRSAVLSIISRGDIAQELTSFGVDPADAQARIAAMTDAEVASLKADLEAAPAGASAGWLIIGIVVGVVLWWIFWKKA